MNEIDLRNLDDEAAREVVRKSLLLLDDERNSGEITDELYEQTRLKYLTYGKELIDHESVTPQSAPQTKVVGIDRKRSSKRRFVWTGIVASAALVTVLLLINNRSNRTNDQPVSGGISQSSADVLAQANAAQQSGDIANALRLYDQVLRDDPNNLDALSSRGWTLYIAGAAVSGNATANATKLIDESLADLDKAISIDPTYSPARAWRGIVRFRSRNDAAGAVQDLDAYLAANPNDGLHDLVQSVRDQAAASINK